MRAPSSVSALAMMRRSDWGFRRPRHTFRAGEAEEADVTRHRTEEERLVVGEGDWRQRLCEERRIDSSGEAGSENRPLDGEDRATEARHSF
jgi:hypothetical protein